MTSGANKMPGSRLSWEMLFLAVAGAAFTYALFEWLFEVTKPSFMDVLSLGARVEIFILTGGLLTAVGLTAVALLAGLSRVKRLQSWQDTLILLSALLPAGMLASLALLMIDNFTYTLFRFGIVSTVGVWRGVYGLGFVMLVAWFYWQVVRWLRQTPRWLQSKQVRRFLLAMLVVVIVVSIGNIWYKNLLEQQAAAFGEIASGSKRPHIILLTSDGLDAQRMSVYGYERQTTPFLETLAPEMLVSENHFTNSRVTFGSVLSIYTSRYPVSTRAIYPPDILRGSDSYLHFPGLLNNLGYRTVQISAPVHVDAVAMNLLNGFDLTNDRSQNQSGVLQQYGRLLPEDFAYFLYGTSNRLVDRLRHIFYLKMMLNPYEIVTQSTTYYSDETRLKLLMREIWETSEPLFVHVHFWATHGPTFTIPDRVFSSELNKDIEWDEDTYDDAVLTFDAYVARVVEALKKSGRWDKTILIVASDHGQNWSPYKRLPLLIRFPAGEAASHIQVNTQNIDLAPTLLDYMDIPIPAWMQGDSLLGGMSE